MKPNLKEELKKRAKKPKDEKDEEETKKEEAGETPAKERVEDLKKRFRK